MEPVATSLQAMSGIALVAAVTVLAEVGDFRRFTYARQLMAYLGLVPKRTLPRKQRPAPRNYRGRQCACA
jgi:hypothetical protein